ncbi:kelch repeat protein [Sporothrix brasiliensis 5110]|uniref:Kelch repeat protein n=1 Tax=Sporothrix brasiliensis 5110 TaxID=1398154 RepID=A0A0C2IC47_9PEZI|nr:kelch repeat protein [Sporothrix brasiliensis 5110]KIH86876.1 kelch repeat protein [Sporothrix brasiliensis 5110]
MEQIQQLKRRTTDLLQSLPETLSPTKTTFGNIFSSSQSAAPQDDSLKGTWQRVAIPSLPRSSSSINVIAGTAYVFGGESVNARKPVDNVMHALVLPTGSASADYYTIKAAPAKKPAVPEAPKLTISEPPPESDPVAIVEPQLVTPDSTVSGEEAETATTATGSEGQGEAAEAIGLDSKDAKGKGRVTEQDSTGAVDEIPLPGPALGDVPSPRVGHATAVIGNRIFLFGGRGGPDMKPLEERGRVWVFDTKTHTWSFLDPLAPSAPVPLQAVPETGHAATVATTAAAPSSVNRPIFPEARSYHAATASDLPASADDPLSSSFAKRGRVSSWKEWVEGDMAEVGTPQRPIVGNIAARARDADSDGYGTFIVHGGCLASGGRTNDLWAFDVRTRVWQALPSAPGLPRGGTSICISRNRLYRFGGFNGSTEEGGRLDFLQLELNTLTDTSVDNADVTLAAKGAWQSIVAETSPVVSNTASVAADSAAAEEATAGRDSDAAPLVSGATWPGDRSVSSLETISAGGGWEYLVLALGERTPSGTGHEAAGTFWRDVWAFQVPSDNFSAASVSNAVRYVLPRRLFGGASGAGEGRWSRVVTAPYDADDDTAGEGPEFGPEARGWIASSRIGELEENGIVIFGGLNEKNQRLGDAWIFRLGADTRE